jgi:hypothetical protein
MSSNPNLVINGNEADSMIWGLLHPAVVTIDVELTDGRVITTKPQDEHGFAENFFLVAFPTHTERGVELLDALVARDADGAELQRLDDIGGWPRHRYPPSPDRASRAVSFPPAPSNLARSRTSAGPSRRRDYRALHWGFAVLRRASCERRDYASYVLPLAEPRTGSGRVTPQRFWPDA